MATAFAKTSSLTPAAASRSRPAISIDTSVALLWLSTLLDALGSSLAERAHSITKDEAVIPTILHDLGYDARGLLRRPAFTAIVIATMALGIGANAAIFTVVNGILLQPL